MSKTALFISIIAIALLQTTSYALIHFFGNSIPLVIISLVLISMWRPDLLIWSGVISGLVLDISSITYFGAWTIFYGTVSYVLHWVGQQPRQQWWWKVMVAASAIVGMPVYVQCVNGQWQPSAWLPMIIAPAIFASSILLIPCWLMAKGVRK